MPRNEEDIFAGMTARETAALRAEQERTKFIKRLILIGCIVVVGGIFTIFGWPLTIVSSGHVGVISRFGEVQQTVLPEGLHAIRPFSDKVIEVSTQVQKYEVKAAASSKDLQDVDTTVAVNFHIVSSRAWWVYQNLRDEYDLRVIAPAVQEAIKATTAKFTAEELIKQRDVVKNKIQDELTKKLLDNGIQVTNVSIVNFSFSKSYTDSIEQKQVADQNAQKATNDLARIKVEAQQTIETAKAQAELLRLQREQVTPMMVQMEAIKKWDGKLPSYMGGGAPLPFIDVLAASKK